MQDSSHLSEEEIKKTVMDEMRFHFLFNSLNSIRYMIYRDQEQAYSMVHDLAVFMRGQIDSILSDEMIQLSDELRYAKAYAMLEKAQNAAMGVEWLCICQEGFVPGGTVCHAVEAVVKKYIRGCAVKKTLVVEDIYDWCHIIRIWVLEEGEESAVLIAVSDTPRSWAPQESQELQ